MTAFRAAAMRLRHWVSCVGLCIGGALLVQGASESAEFLVAEDFFHDPTLWSIKISPTGEFFAAVTKDSVGGSSVFFRGAVFGTGDTVIFIRHMQSKIMRAAIRVSGDVQFIGWVDDDTVIVRYGGRQSGHVQSIDVGFADGELVLEADPIWTPGWIVDGIPNQKDEILWAYAQKERTVVYRAPLAKLKEFPSQVGKKNAKPWSGLGDDYTVAEIDGFVPVWITDRDGVVRGAVGIEGGETPEVMLRYREAQDAPWKEIYRTEDLEEVIVPVGVAPDNKNLLVLSNKGRDTTALVEFEVDTGELASVLFAHPTADIQGVTYDFNGMKILSAVYEEGGITRYHQFDAFNDRFQRSLEHAFPGKSVAITSTSRDARYFSVLVSSPRNAGTFYILDTEKRIADFVDNTMPWLDENAMADAQVLEVTGADGTKIEAFLTIPVDSAGKPPLLVLPHGGPYGVRDSRVFDPLVQYIASWNIAVLQVNFRGSAGYGKTFAEAGYRERAKGIEDDIEAAVDFVVEKGLVDRTRMCIAGMSYGGYSAMISAIRQPDRYRCAATISGVSDLPLQLYWDRRGLTNKDVKAIDVAFGDPTVEYDEMIAISPAYRADEIQVPVLIVHGTQDRRVDVEHAYRLKAMLEAHGKPFSWHLLQGAGHSPNHRQSLEVARVLGMFVNDYLSPASTESAASDAVSAH